MVKAKAGMSDEYLKGLAKTFTAAMDEAKKQNVIMDYKILLGYGGIEKHGGARRFP